MNQFINFFWSIICFAPVVIYWAKEYDVSWLIISLLISIASLFIPSRLLQLSSRPQFYEATGIKFIRRFVQNGEYAKRLAHRQDRGYRLIKNKKQAVSYLRTIAVYERFHFLCLIFFLITAILAFVHYLYGLATIIIIANIIYNICPILLQQYNKARLLKFSK